MRVLIASWNGGGNVPPALNLGSRLVRRGHRVRLLGWPATAGAAAAAGLEFGTYPTAPQWPEERVHEDDWDLLGECLWGERCAADVRDAVRAFGADVLVVDCMLRAGFDAARTCSVSTVALVHVSYYEFLHGWGSAAMGTDVATLLAPCAAVLAVSVPGFDPPGPLPAGHEYVGSIGYPGRRELEPELRDRLAAPGPPWVLISLSTTTQHGQRATLERILTAVGDLPVHALVTLAGTVTAGELRPPPNVILTGHQPHDALLPHVAAFVTHAGLAGVTTALDAGVPMVCIPQGRDQDGNAARVAATGTGVALDADAGPAAIAAALRAVLDEASYRQAAQRIARLAQPLGHGARAADVVESRAAAARSTAA